MTKPLPVFSDLVAWNTTHLLATPKCVQLSFSSQLQTRVSSSLLDFSAWKGDRHPQGGTPELNSYQALLQKPASSQARPAPPLVCSGQNLELPGLLFLPHLTSDWAGSATTTCLDCISHQLYSPALVPVPLNSAGPRSPGSLLSWATRVAVTSSSALDHPGRRGGERASLSGERPKSFRGIQDSF